MDTYIKPGDIIEVAFSKNGGTKSSVWQVISTKENKLHLFNPHFFDHTISLDIESDNYTVSSLIETKTDSSYWTRFSDWDFLIEPETE